MPEIIDFAAVTACARNGHSPAAARFTNAQGSIMYSFVVCVANFPANGCGRKQLGIPSIIKYLAALAARYHNKE